jgi:outer membrane protein assembly factor BamB
MSLFLPSDVFLLIELVDEKAVFDGLPYFQIGLGAVARLGNRLQNLEKLRKAGKSEAELAEAAKTLGAAGEIWCLEEKTGKVQWTHKVPDTVLGAVAAGTNGLFFGARDGYVYCLSLAGTEIRKWNAHAPLLTSPVLAGDNVYVVTESGVLFGLRAEDLEPIWESRIGFVKPFISSPAVARGHVYVGSAQDGLLCLGKPGSQQREVRWAGFAGGPGCGGNVDGQPLPEKGKFAWRFPDNENADQPLDLQITAPPACLNDALYVPADGGRKGLLCVRETETEGSARGSEAWFVATTNGVKLSPAVTTNAVFFVDGQKGDANRRLHCASAADGKVAWTLPVAADASGEFVLTDREGLIADSPGRLTAFELTGQVKWQADCGNVSGMPVANDVMIVIATEQPAGIAVLDRASGRTLWCLDMEAPPTAAPLVRKHTLYYGTSTGVVARRLADGAQVWEAPTGAPGAPLVLVKNRIACTTVDGQMAIIDVESGAVEKTLEGALPGLPPLAALDSFVYATKNSLMVWPGTGEPLSWTKTDWLGRLTCAPVMVNSRIYVATDKKGLVCLKSK